MGSRCVGANRACVSHSRAGSLLIFWSAHGRKRIGQLIYNLEQRSSRFVKAIGRRLILGGFAGASYACQIWIVALQCGIEAKIAFQLIEPFAYISDAFSHLRFVALILLNRRR